MQHQYFPLSKSEEGLYISSLSGGDAYNLANLVNLGKDYSLSDIKLAINKVFEAHPYLFTVLSSDDNGNIVKSIVREDIKIDEEKVDEVKVDSLPYELLNKHLYRFKVFNVKGDHILYFDFHHILMDGTSIKIFIDDLFKALEGKQLEKEVGNANDFALNEAKIIENKDYQASKDYFEKLVGDVETDSTIVEDKADQEISYGNIRKSLKIKDEQVKKITKSLGIKTSSYFLGAFSFLLAKFNMDNEALFLTVNNARSEEVRNSFGSYVKTYPFFIHFEDDTVSDLLKRSNEENIESVKHLDYPFSMLAKDLGLSADILFAYQGDYFYKGNLNGKEVEVTPLLRKDGKEKLAIELHRLGNEYVIWVEYRADLYNEKSIEQLIKIYEQILLEFLVREKLADVNLVDEKEEKLLESFNVIDAPYIGDGHTILDEFDNCVKKYPNNLAVVFKDHKYTYKEVDEITTRIANELIKRGAGREKVVSILINKSEYIVLASLAVVKSGAAYQPLDPSYPQERLNFMVNDSSAIILIRDDNLSGIITEFKGEEILVSELLSFKDNSPIKTRPSPQDLFIMLYTSGSTGLPKGVMLEHGNIYTFCKYYQRQMDLTSDSRVSAYASYGFDADMMDLYPTLTIGACVYVIPDEMRLNLMELGEYFNSNKITHSFITTQVGRQFASEVECASLTHFALGGEKLVPIAPPKGYKFYNLYGPTEGTVFCTIQLVNQLYHRVPIGPTLPTYKAYVLDKNKKRLPTLVNGELYISGPQVARGYLNREKEHKEAFLNNWFTDDPNFKRLYKTGDIVRFLPDGTIDFIGRKDGQVKIRGFRIELSEVEKVIREYPSIKDATVKDFTDPSGVKFIVAYVVSDEKVSVEDLNEFIRSKKPPYMVPAYTMQLDKIPLNQNQKVNKRALPMPEIKQEEVIAPRNEDEQAIFDIVKDVIGHDQFGVTNNIFDVGLTSVSSIRLTILLSKKYGKSVENSDLKENPTIEGLAKFLLNKSEEEESFELLEEYPLSKTQEGIFVECVSKANSTNYNIPYLFKLDKNIDLNKLKQALIKVVDAHPYLKTTLLMNDNGDILARRKDVPAEVSIIKGEIDKSKLVRPFTILDSPLYRIEIYEGKDNYLYLDFHHIICDGTSEAIILSDLNKAYLGEELTLETYTGFEIALKEKADLASDKLDKAKAFYQNVLKDVDGKYTLKPDLKVAKTSKLASIDYSLNLNSELIKKFVSDNKVTSNALFNFAFAFTLSKFLYKNEALYTTIYNGRKSSKMMNTVSMLVKTLPVYLKYEDNSDILSKINEMKVLLEGLEENDLYSFGDVVNDYDISADIIFAYQGDDFLFDNIGGYKVSSILLESDTPKSDFGLDIFLENGVYRAHYEWDQAIYNNYSIASFNRLFELVLGQLINKKNISELNLLPKEDEEILKDVNNTHVDVEDVTVNVLLERQAIKNKDKVAVIGCNGQFTYDEFNKAANKVAHTLLDNKVELSQPVVMFMPRIKEAYVVRQGIVKSGGAFVPIDPKYPDDRVEYIITDSKSKFMLSTREIIANRQDLIKKTGIIPFAIEDVLTSKKDDNPNVKIPSTSLAYMIYTSGSTGKPKGVMIAHHNLMNYVCDGSNLATREYREIGNDCVACSFASFSFDASLQEEFVVLTHGYTAVIASEEEIENPLLLAKTLKKNKVNVMFMTPSFVSNFVDMEEFIDALRGFKQLDMGAENVPIELCNKLRGLGVNATINNGYGPTETTITCTYSLVRDEYMTIGKPVANTKVYILDKTGHILPTNAIGDLTIAGDSVGLGYYGMPEKTKTAFIEVNGERAYRTGDLARINNDGNVEFFGRLDNQVKLRGLRVELDEIEKVLNSYPGVSNSVILVKTNPTDGDYLVAYFAASKEVDKDDLTAHMAKSLTPYMIPKVMMQLEKIPLTPNGKIDKKALPEPVMEEKKKDVKAASNDLEEKLLGIFKKVLGTDNVGVDDDFFEMGGTSLSVSKVAMFALNASLPIAYGDVFDYPTVLELEKHIAEITGEATNKKEEKRETVSDNKALIHNTVAEINDVIAEHEIKKVLLTGATGFLGIHILRELMNQNINVVALVRGNSELSSRERLSALLAYYFDSPLNKEVDRLVEVVDGDVTDKTLIEKLEQYDFDTIINAAAIVKHFANDDIIERVNVGGVVNLIEVAKEKKCRIIQISTLSVAGENIDNKFAPSFKMKEDMLDFGQDVSNKYVHSKFNAEKAILEAAENGVDAKVIRVGNLMGRNSDGEFQANSITNGFMRDLKGYATLHKFPVNSMDITVDFSPIDEVAKTIILLAKTPQKFTIFHSANSHMVEMGDIIYVLNELGFDIKVVSDEEFLESMKKMMMDDTKSMLVSSLISYSSSDMHTHSFILSDNEFTNKALYHLGYKWPITDYQYLRNAIEALETLGFFERTDI
ncbi:MAG: amino acid adenylation domain-containing protein [Erysipelotrichaceae bacterium]|nr:amino acid adenylation domain-containing protein [Erysipelotrichaceae bacterium]